MPKFNKKEHTGNYMLRNLCNSWFHLIADCPHRTHATQIMFEEEDDLELEEEPIQIPEVLRTKLRTKTRGTR